MASSSNQPGDTQGLEPPGSPERVKPPMDQGGNPENASKRFPFKAVLGATLTPKKEIPCMDPIRNPFKGIQ